MTTIASYLILIMLSCYYFFDGARDTVMIDMAVKREALIVSLISYDLKQLQNVRVDRI